MAGSLGPGGTATLTGCEDNEVVLRGEQKDLEQDGIQRRDVLCSMLYTLEF